MAGWADIPVDILILIAQRLMCIEDYICLCYACKPWQIITSILGSKPNLPPRFPWVMLPEVRDESNGQNENRVTRRFYSLSTSKIYEFELPEAAERKCIGAYHGCLLTVGCDFQINILHPFSRLQTTMPPLLTFKHQMVYDEDRQPLEIIYFFVAKVVMSRSPYNDNFLENEKNKQVDCIVVAIYGPHKLLAYARPGDEIWTDIVVPGLCYEKAFCDVIYFNGKFYALNLQGCLYICDFDNEISPKAKVLGPSPFPQFGAHRFDSKYLIESCGDLLLVLRSRCKNRMDGLHTFHGLTNMSQRYSTTGFSIFRLEECHGDDGIIEYPYRWIEVKTLGDMALFLGNNVSVSICASKCVKANCIYFSEDDVTRYKYDPDGGGHDTGIFDMKTNTFESHYASEFCCSLTPPVWYI